MTHHTLPQHDIEDQRILRRLGLVVGVFFVATALMALTVGIIMG